MLNTSHEWGISARAHVQTALLYLRNGLADCVQIWYVGWGVTKYVLSTSHGWGGTTLHMHTCTVSEKWFHDLNSQNIFDATGRTKFSNVCSNNFAFTSSGTIHATFANF